MNLIFCYWKSICEPGMTNAFKALGHTVLPFRESFKDKDLDTDYMLKLSNFIQQQKNVDFVFTVNFIPIIAKTCKVHHIYYLSYIVDSPCMPLYSQSLGSPYNHAFLFDYCLYQQFSAYYPKQVHYLPLGADHFSYESLTISDSDYHKYGCDVSFIGSYHTEFCKYDKIEKNLPDYICGYVQGLIRAQQNVYGYNFIADSINNSWIQEFKKYADYSLLPDYNVDDKSLIADMYIGYKCTQQDRIHTLNEVSKHFSLDLYTTEKKSLVPQANFKGIADSKNMMPKIFHCSKINLNMTARTIQSGIPQRIFDIMIAGGFVISNYQSEIPEYFTPGEDIVLYESVPDLLEKINYYLKHEEQRKEIAQNGRNRVLQNYTYVQRIKQLLKDSGF